MAWFVALQLVAASCADPTGLTSRLQDGSRASEGRLTSGTTYYVSPAGDDSNNGTSIGSPWKSIARVDAQDFAAGDRVLFQGGATFAGVLAFDAADQGSPSAPIVVSSYGTGAATIDGGSAGAVTLYNTSGFELHRLRLTGAGRTINTASGINIYSDLPGPALLPYIRIDSVDVSGFGQYGIGIGSWNTTGGFIDVRVQFASLHDNGLGGLLTYAEHPYTHQNVTVSHVYAFNNPGVPGLAHNSGSGIALGGVSGGTIERSVAHDNGWLCDAPEGPVGIWTYDSERVVIEHNESHHNRTNGLADGGGFDLDQNSRLSLMQYNYSHDNDGAGFLLSHGLADANHTGNVVRYNVSENDARKNSVGAIAVWGRTVNAEIHNNSVYLKPSSTGSPRAVSVYAASTATVVQALHIRSNVFYADAGATTLWVSPEQAASAVDLRFEGNDYFAGGARPQFLWGTSTYLGIRGWRSATGQETLNGLPTGAQVDPRLVSPGTGGTIGNADLLSTLVAYQLKPSSPLIDRALDLLSVFGVDPGPADFYAGSVPAGAGYDVGAHEWR